MGAVRGSLVAIGVAGALVLAAAGCSGDLFHDTSWPSACDLDPTTPGCPAGGDEQDGGAADGDAGGAPDGAAD